MSTEGEYFHDGVFLGLEFLSENFSTSDDLRLILSDHSGVKFSVYCTGCIGIKLVNFERPSYISRLEVASHFRRNEFPHGQMVTRKIFDELLGDRSDLSLVELHTHVEADLWVVCDEVRIASE